MRGAKVTLCESFSGDLTVLCKGGKVKFKLLQSGTMPVADEKTLDARVDAALAAQAKKPAYKPAPDHPWRRTYASAAWRRA